MMNREDSGLKAGERLDDLQIKGYEIIPVSYTHLTLPTKA